MAGKILRAKRSRIRAVQAASAKDVATAPDGDGQGHWWQAPTEELRALGWIILEAGDVLPDHRSYREFLRTSKAEWSVAKHGYVAGRTGWFSCARPVISRSDGRRLSKKRAGATNIPRRRRAARFSPPARRSGRSDCRHQTTTTPSIKPPHAHLPCNISRRKKSAADLLTQSGLEP